jgi:hypothetical protein
VSGPSAQDHYHHHLPYHRSMPAARRFPPPWTIEEHNNACFIVRDATGAGTRVRLFREEPPEPSVAAGQRSCGTAFHRAGKDPTNAKLPQLVRNVSLSWW